MSKISSEVVFDLLPFMIDIFDKLDVEKEGKRLVKISKTKDIDVQKKEIGVNIIKYILKNSPKVKDEFFEVVSIVEGITIEEAKAQGIGKTIKTIQEVMGDEEIMVFFR
jgi:hypothetical protein